MHLPALSLLRNIQIVILLFTR
ncbi:hypothetical protein BAE44_0017747 [Dichanthelium oligosanthes]|uniref:Uncharacterized protein n=1 Tax=Dichanthelium oligosanthes TaxID=888268 RepID=A0A1E5V880_9POAL|nr:hypothetical protein BAE44_0017747 [Dichanthelium oligosanthes]